MRIVSGFIVGLISLSLLVGVPIGALMGIGWIANLVLRLSVDGTYMPALMMQFLLGLAVSLCAILVWLVLQRITEFGNMILKETSPYGEDDTRYDRKIQL